MSKLPDNTHASFNSLLQQIQQARRKVLAQVNTALIDLYWQVGKTISEKVQSETWGKGVVRELAQYIAQNAPDIKGFSDKNLWRMKQFYETYATDEKLSSLVRALPWTHNTIIFSRCKSAEERAYYLNLCRTEHYTSRELERQIDAAQFERNAIGQPKLSAALRELHPNIQHAFKDNYVLEFLNLCVLLILRKKKKAASIRAMAETDYAGLQKLSHITENILLLVDRVRCVGMSCLQQVVFMQLNML